MQLRGTELDTAIQLLELFCYGTWNDYRGTKSLKSFDHVPLSEVLASD